MPRKNGPCSSPCFGCNSSKFKSVVHSCVSLTVIDPTIIGRRHPLNPLGLSSLRQSLDFLFSVIPKRRRHSLAPLHHPPAPSSVYLPHCSHSTRRVVCTCPHPAYLISLTLKNLIRVADDRTSADTKE